MNCFLNKIFFVAILLVALIVLFSKGIPAQEVQGQSMSGFRKVQAIDSMVQGIMDRRDQLQVFRGLESYKGWKIVYEAFFEDDEVILFRCYLDRNPLQFEYWTWVYKNSDPVFFSIKVRLKELAQGNMLLKEFTQNLYFENGRFIFGRNLDRRISSLPNSREAQQIYDDGRDYARISRDAFLKEKNQPVIDKIYQCNDQSYLMISFQPDLAQVSLHRTGGDVLVLPQKGGVANTQFADSRQTLFFNMDQDNVNWIVNGERPRSCSLISME